MYLASFSVACTTIAGASASKENATSLTKPNRKILSHSRAVNPMTVGGVNSNNILVMKPSATEKVMKTGAKYLNQSWTFLVLS